MADKNLNVYLKLHADHFLTNIDKVKTQVNMLANLTASVKPMPAIALGLQTTQAAVTSTKSSVDRTNVALRGTANEINNVANAMQNLDRIVNTSSASMAGYRPINQPFDVGLTKGVPTGKTGERYPVQSAVFSPGATSDFLQMQSRFAEYEKNFVPIYEKQKPLFATELANLEKRREIVKDIRGKEEAILDTMRKQAMAASQTKFRDISLSGLPDSYAIRAMRSMTAPSFSPETFKTIDVGAEGFMNKVSATAQTTARLLIDRWVNSVSDELNRLAVRADVTSRSKGTDRYAMSFDERANALAKLSYNQRDFTTRDEDMFSKMRMFYTAQEPGFLSPQKKPGAITDPRPGFQESSTRQMYPTLDKFIEAQQAKIDAILAKGANMTTADTQAIEQARLAIEKYRLEIEATVKAKAQLILKDAEMRRALKGKLSASEISNKEERAARLAQARAVYASQLEAEPPVIDRTLGAYTQRESQAQYMAQLKSMKDLTKETAIAYIRDTTNTISDAANQLRAKGMTGNEIAAEMARRNAELAKAQARYAFENRTWGSEMRMEDPEALARMSNYYRAQQAAMAGYPSGPSYDARPGYGASEQIKTRLASEQANISRRMGKGEGITDTDIASINASRQAIAQLRMEQEALIKVRAQQIQQSAQLRMSLKQEALEASKAMGIPQDVLKSYKFAPKELDKITEAFNRMVSASKTSAGGLQAVNKYIKDVQSGVVVKGSGKPMGLDIGEKDIAILDAARQKMPQLTEALRAQGIVIDQTYGKFTRLLVSAGNYMKFQMGWFLGAGAIFAVVSTIRGMASAVVEFEQTMKNIQAVTGLSAEGIDLVANAARRVSVETPLAAVEVAKLGLQLVRAGLGAREATAAMEVAAKVAVVSGEDTKTVADAIATAMMAWKMGATEAERVGNALAIAMNESRLTVQDIGTAFNYVAGTASAMNISLEETLSVLSVMSNLGVRASTMSTGWIQFMARMVAPSGKFNEYLQRVGADISKLDPMQIQGPHKMATIMRELERINFSAADAFQYLETRAARFFLFMKTAGPDAIEEMEAKMQEVGKLQKAFDTSMEGFKNTMAKLRNQAVAVALGLGEALLPALKALADILSILAAMVVHTANVLGKIPTAVYAVAIAVWRGVVAWRAYSAAVKTATVVTVAGQGTMLMAEAAKTGAVLAKAFPLITRIVSWFGVWGKIIAGIIAVLGVGTLIDKIFGGENKIKQYEKGLEGIRKESKQMQEQIEAGSEGFEEYSINIKQHFQNISSGLKELEKDYKFPDRFVTPSLDSNAVFAFAEASNEVERLQVELDKVNDRLARTPERWEIWAQAAKDAVRGIWNYMKEFASFIGTTFTEVFNQLPFAQAPQISTLFHTGTEYLAQKQDADLRAQQEQLAKELVAAKQAHVLAQNELNKGFTIDPKSLIAQVKPFPVAERKKEAERIIKENFEALKPKILAANMKLEMDLAESIRKENAKRQGMGLPILTQPKSVPQMVTDAQIATDAGMNDAARKTMGEFMDFIKKMEQQESPLIAAKKRRLTVLIAQQKEQIEAVKLASEAELEASKHTSEMKKITDERSRMELEAGLKQQEMMNEWYYSNDLISVAAYYNEKTRLRSLFLASEIDAINKEAEAKKAALQTDIKAARTRIEAFEAAEAELRARHNLVGVPPLVEGPDDPNATADAKALKIITDTAWNKVAEYINQVRELKNTIKKLENEIERIDPEFKNKRLGKESAAALEQIKQDLEKPLKALEKETQKKTEILNLKKEQNQLMVEAYELTGQWDKAQETRIVLMKQEHELARLTKQLEIDKLDLTIKQFKAQTLLNDADTAELKQLELKKQLNEDILAAMAKAQAERERRTVAMSTPEGAMGLAFQDLYNEWQKVNEQIHDLAKGTAQAAQGAFSEFFFDAMQGKLKTALDYWMSFSSSVMRILSDMLSKWVASQIMEGMPDSWKNAIGLKTGITAEADEKARLLGINNVLAASSMDVARSASYEAMQVDQLIQKYVALNQAKAGGMTGGFGGFNVNPDFMGGTNFAGSQQIAANLGDSLRSGGGVGFTGLPELSFAEFDTSSINNYTTAVAQAANATTQANASTGQWMGMLGPLVGQLGSAAGATGQWQAAIGLVSQFMPMLLGQINTMTTGSMSAAQGHIQEAGAAAALTGANYALSTSYMWLAFAKMAAGAMHGGGVAGAGSTITSASGGTTAGTIVLGRHSGGNIPKFHDGGLPKLHFGGIGMPKLKPDEVPIIAQVGERMLSREQNKQMTEILMAAKHTRELKPVVPVTSSNPEQDKWYKQMLRTISGDFATPEKYHSGGAVGFRHEGGSVDREYIDRRRSNVSTVTNNVTNNERHERPVIVNMTVQAMDAKSFNGYIHQNKKALADAFMAAGADNHRSRRG